MPTIILLDASLSMSCPVPIQDSTEEFRRYNLAAHGINTLLDHCNNHTKQEFISLMTYSFNYDYVVPFTRDYDSIRSAVNKHEIFNKTCILTALSAVSSIVIEEWGTNIPCQVIIITDGSVGFGVGSLQSIVEKGSPDSKPLLPFAFSCKIHIALLATGSETGVQNSISLYQKLIDMNEGNGEIYQPDGQLGLKSVEQMFKNLAQKYYVPYTGLLTFGNMRSNVTLFPAPEVYEKETDTEYICKKVHTTLEICGFLDIGDISSPPCVSRHLVLPVAQEKSGEVKDDEDADGKSVPAFTVLLHGSLKVLGMVAFTRVAEDWYGIIYSCADNKKKSNLMLSLFEPGIKSIPWLGDLNNLGPISDFAESPYGEDDSKTPFPVRPAERHSYSQNCVVWIKPSGLQADIQKVLRHARKLPEKLHHFYKELNRLRRAALSFGFNQLLETMSAMLERECTLLPGTAHPDAALQLTHAANALRSDMATDILQNIVPMSTNFTKD